MIIVDCVYLQERKTEYIVLLVLHRYCYFSISRNTDMAMQVVLPGEAAVSGIACRRSHLASICTSLAAVRPADSVWQCRQRARQLSGVLLTAGRRQEGRRIVSEVASAAVRPHWPSS